MPCRARTSDRLRQRLGANRHGRYARGGRRRAGRGTPNGVGDWYGDSSRRTARQRTARDTIGAVAVSGAGRLDVGMVNWVDGVENAPILLVQ
jgi:hypothetical protein